MSARVVETAGARLSRLLAVVPWLAANDGVSIAEAARHFGVTEKQLSDDLWLLICTGRPGHLHGDLVDIQFWDEDGSIHVLASCRPVISLCVHCPTGRDPVAPRLRCFVIGLFPVQG